MKMTLQRLSLLVIAALMAVCLSAYIGCSSKETTEESDTSQSATQEAQTAAQAVKSAETVVAALSNPKTGVDPVCGMAIDENAVIVTLEGKKYGFCSDRCAETFKETPDKFLVAVAEEETGHEGHDHD